ncbi:MAG: family 43 glycosylhydrolase [Phycisphaerae bacterium]
MPVRPANPLISEPGMSDPHALVLGDVCYLYTGHDVGFGIDDWVMPDWRIFRSDDLQTWTHVGTISPADNYMGAGNTGCWGGDIVRRHGKYYWYFSNRNKETGVMVASEPQGPFVDALGGPLVDSFDPSIFTEDDGTCYIIYGHGEYKIARLKESMVELDEKPRTISIDRKGVFPKMDKNSLHKHNGIYYLSCSGYYAVSRNLYGPYEYRGLVGRGWQLDSIYGHGDFFVWRGDWYHVWCRYRDRGRDRIRDCFMAPVVYGDDGSMRDDLTALEG